MTREEILNKAKECVCGDRDKQYGEPEDCFELIAKYWEVYLAQKGTLLELFGEDIAAMMVLLKIARNQYKSKDDNWIDIAGYAACGAEPVNMKPTKHCEHCKQKIERPHYMLIDKSGWVEYICEKCLGGQND